MIKKSKKGNSSKHKLEIEFYERQLDPIKKEIQNKFQNHVDRNKGFSVIQKYQPRNSKSPIKFKIEAMIYSDFLKFCGFFDQSPEQQTSFSPKSKSNF